MPISTYTPEGRASGSREWPSRSEPQVSLCCALGGETGRVLRALIGAEGVDVQSVESGASNGAYIHDRRSGERIEVAVTPAGHLGRHDVDELYGVTLASGLDADVTLLSGVQPEQILDADVYRRLAGDLRANGRTVIADLTGAPLAAALAGGLAVLKLSQRGAARREADRERRRGRRTQGYARPEASRRQQRAALARAGSGPRPRRRA